MLKPRKRITKRQIKEDKFVTYYFKTIDFLQHHVREIVTGIGAIAIIFVIYAFYSRAQFNKEQSALTQFAKARTEYFKKNYETASSLLLSLVNNYDGTGSGELAKFYLADSYFNLKKYDDAEKYFREYSSRASDPTLAASALAGVAACLEEKTDFLGAAQTYKEAADKFRDEFMAPQNLLNSARCYNLAGDNAQAQVILNELINTYSKSQLKSEAEMLLAEIVS